MAAGWQVRRPVRRFHLAAGNYAIQGPVCAAAQEGRRTGRRGRNAIEDTSDDPEVAVQKKDTSAALRKCLTALSSDHREIVDLVYYHEKSVEEVAEIVGIPENTVKTRLFYARKKLADLLKAAGIERGWP